MSEKVRVRFAPSPTGHLHLGNVRTALFNWLFARARGGVFILRIEDTDAERSTDAAVASVVEDLEWLGLSWEEGPGVGGPYGPYRQTERYSIYEEHVSRLLESGRAYPCYCTNEELAALREEAEAQKKTFIYPGTCRKLTASQRAEREAEGRKPAVRLLVAPRNVTFRDLVRGAVSIHTSHFGDWVLTRPDGSPTYNFAVVVDDALMRITHVIRGEDHLSNTPKQILLYEALGWEPPAFAHLSMILGPDGSKLSKRHGDVSLYAFREKGMLPSALANGLALLGWSDEQEREVLTLQEIVERFDLERVNKSAAVFDEPKLLHLNHEHLKRLSDARLAMLMRPYLERAGRLPEGHLTEDATVWLFGVAGLIRERIQLLSDVVCATDVFWSFDPEAMDEEAMKILEEPDAHRVVRAFAEKAEVADLATHGVYREVALSLRDCLKVKGRALFHPIRVAVTGSASGPDLETLIPLLTQGSRLDLPEPVAGPCQRAWEVVQFMSGLK